MENKTMEDIVKGCLDEDMYNKKEQLFLASLYNAEPIPLDYLYARLFSRKARLERLEKMDAPEQFLKSEQALISRAEKDIETRLGIIESIYNNSNHFLKSEGNIGSCVLQMTEEKLIHEIKELIRVLKGQIFEARAEIEVDTAAAFESVVKRLQRLLRKYEKEKKSSTRSE
jgi:ribosome-associated translation inhibitor RaiA